MDYSQFGRDDFLYNIFDELRIEKNENRYAHNKPDREAYVGFYHSYVERYWVNGYHFPVRRTLLSRFSLTRTKFI